MGDFNARTYMYDKLDFIDADDYFPDLFDFNVNSLEHFNASSKLDGSELS